MMPMSGVYSTEETFTRYIRMNTFLLMILAIFCPPFPVYKQWGCSYHLVTNIFLTCFAWVLGIVHAWMMISIYSALSCKDYLMTLMDDEKEVFIEEPKVLQENSKEPSPVLFVDL
nr:Uncharacterised protein family UPF0057 domain containing protein [Haemonchus contortus]